MDQVSFTNEARAAILVAVQLATARGCVEVDPSFLALALLERNPGQAVSLLREMAIPETSFRERVCQEMSLVPKGGAGRQPRISPSLSGLVRSSAEDGTVTFEALFRAVAEEFRPARPEAPAPEAPAPEAPAPEEPGPVTSGRPAASQPSDGGDMRALTRYSENLNDLARDGKLPLSIGRNDEILEVETALLRKDKCNPVLVGAPGVGKSNIIEGLANRIVKGEVPEGLRELVIYRLEMSDLTAGSSVRGEFEGRLKALIRVLKNHPECALFIDEFHQLIGAGGNGAMDASNILKPAMARGAVKIIGATTDDEYARYIEGDKAFERRLQKVRVQELPEDKTVEVLLGVKPAYETFHRVTAGDDLVRLAVRLTSLYVPSRCQPDKAIDLLDESMARTRLQGGGALDEDLLRAVLEKWTGIPASRLGAEEVRNLQDLEERLAGRVRGQEQAIVPVASAIRRNMLHLTDHTRPIGSFLFVGPTGVGKTELAKVLAEEVMGSRDDIIRIDMSEYQAPHTVSRLFGAPPGYVGYGEGGQLTEAVRRRPHSVVLLDEIEKAHPRIFEAFLQVLEDGRMTDGQGRVVDFRHCLVIMTSNAGSRSFANRRAPIGFTSSVPVLQEADADVDEAVKEIFSPEFLNRLDDIIHFHPLGKDLLVEIADKQLTQLRERLSLEGYTVSFAGDLAPWIATKDAQPEYGARPIRRAIKRHVEDALSKAFLDVERPMDCVWEVLLEDGQVQVRPCTSS